TARDAATVVIPSAIQLQEEWSRLVGAQTCHLPLRLSADAGATLAELALLAQASVLDASEYPIGGVEALRDPLDVSSAPLPPRPPDLVRLSLDPDPVSPAAVWDGLEARIDVVRRSG